MSTVVTYWQFWRVHALACVHCGAIISRVMVGHVSCLMSSSAAAASLRAWSGTGQTDKHKTGRSTLSVADGRGMVAVTYPAMAAAATAATRCFMVLVEVRKKLRTLSLDHLHPVPAACRSRPLVGLPG
jgi:hypothetical protein